ncbi:hypothetical protein BDV27DRAFT_152425 [Aspergillus caelatus]|uniref:Uncharacterized protein n=1 Tax=Aspergillus caelatus TaxID=61420 RepID=A0A5N7ANH1_9EURO|nr:uncharacterized protein BDV27DRAFT_152425 [Aspergillus caelatus]KAE8370270.1 hypothetical protein BDV27DRAFT_152425 [Aspergillus caelatus]
MLPKISKTFIIPAVLAFSAYAATTFSQVYYGAARLYAYQHFVGNGYIANIVEDCNVKEGDTKLKYIQCAADALTYMLGAAVAIGATTSRAGTVAEYIANQGQTLWARDENDVPPMWNWTAIVDNEDNFYGFLGTHLPGDTILTGGNLTHFGLEGNAAVAKHHEGHIYVHANNVTHGVVGKYRLSEQDGTTKRTTYTWDFGNMAGVKYSYDNVCGNYKSQYDQAWMHGLYELSYNFMSWAYNSEPADSYADILYDEADADSPFVRGYMIAETSGFGTNYEEKPQPSGYVPCLIVLGLYRVWCEQLIFHK